MNNKIAVVLTLLGAASLAGCTSAPKGDAGILCPLIGAGFGAALGGGGGAVGGGIVGAIVCANPDQDKDGVANTSDMCPDTPMGTEVDASGCPMVEEMMVEEVVEETVVEEVVEPVVMLPIIPQECEPYVSVDGEKVTGFATIMFGFDKDQYGASEQEKIDCIADVVIANELNVDAVGYTDSTGPKDYNMDLSKRRAANVVQALLDAGVPANDTLKEAKGEMAPAMTNETENGRAHNRRVEVRVY
ncbi:OmpA family protein [Agarivorans sp.]|uniref:OmpA family protein n=1 Tax=Agarivorans sp. TaxID=1872412 RepID=UPI003CFCF2D3